MFIKKIFKNSKGDTIIEVLLSIAVISLVLVISYGLSSRDSQYIQQSQEHGEAQKISEQQLELLRDYLTPDTDWTAANYICFKDNVDPPEPSTSPGDCNKGADGRYHTRISVTSADTYTVHTNWSSLTEVADQSLDLSYKLPVSALAPVGLYPECDDNLDNDGDHKVDFPTDPGCTSLADNDETDPPPPPPPPVIFSWTTSGSSYSFCAPDSTLYLPFGDGNDGCHTSGSYMYAYRNFNAVYSGIPSGFQVGSATIRICYQNYASAAPPAYGGYQLKITPGHGPTQVITLPTATVATERCEDRTININQANFSALRMVWFNDSWTGGDANLRINSIKITQATDPLPQKPNKAIAGENFTSCQINGALYYCLLDDPLYLNSVYSLSSDYGGGTPFRASYKFNGLAAGSYSLGISYFNGNFQNLPPPPGNYKYQVKVTYPGGTSTVQMPIEGNSIGRHLHDYTLGSLNITSANPTITLEWQNDSFNPGVYDANFGINSILLKGN